MNDAEPGVEALFLGGFDVRRGGAGGAAIRDETAKRFIVAGQRLRQRMIGRDRGEARAEQRVRPGREHLEPVETGGRLGEAETEAKALAFADPVFRSAEHTSELQSLMRIS